MPEFLELLPPTLALELLFKNLPQKTPRTETIETQNALGRITAQAVLSPEDLPAFPRSTVDGYAVRARDTFGASDTLPAYLNVVGEVPMGGAPQFEISKGQAALIHTGGMLPRGADAVVMVEMIQSSRDGEIEVLKAVAGLENVIQPGEDVQAGNEVIPAGVKLRPAEIGGLFALGIMKVTVAKKPIVGIISTGDEVIPPDQKAAPGQVRDINSYTLAALVEQCGGEVIRYGILPDQREIITNGVKRALDECDLVVITAGSSASTRDMTADIINQLGKPGVLVHGVNVKPGKPTILAVCDGKPIIGLPGNPVSALVIAGLFVRPVVDLLSGIRKCRSAASLSARLTINLSSQAGREDFIPVELVSTPKGWDAEPIFYKSNLIFTLSRADGLVHIPADANGLAAGEQVEVQIL